MKFACGDICQVEPYNSLGFSTPEIGWFGPYVRKFYATVLSCGTVICPSERLPPDCILAVSVAIPRFPIVIASFADWISSARTTAYCANAASLSIPPRTGGKFPPNIFRYKNG